MEAHQPFPGRMGYMTLRHLPLAPGLSQRYDKHIITPGENHNLADAVGVKVMGGGSSLSRFPDRILKFFALPWFEERSVDLQELSSVVCTVRLKKVGDAFRGQKPHVAYECCPARYSKY